MSKIATIFAMVVCVMVFVAPHGEGLTCGTVVGSLAPCLVYLRNGGIVPEACCSGARSLNAAANSTPARQDACRCMKSAAKAYGVNSMYAAALPKQCNVNVGYAISFNIDCNTVR